MGADGGINIIASTHQQTSNSEACRIMVFVGDLQLPGYTVINHCSSLLY